MKRFSKILLKIFTVTCVMVLGYVPNGFAHKMVFMTDKIVIDSIGEQAKDSTFNATGEWNGSDNIPITEISLEYQGKDSQHHEFSIIEEGTGPLYTYESVKNGLTKDELNGQFRLYLRPGESYKIQHGDKIWNLSLPDKTSLNGGADSLIIAKANEFGIPQWRIEEGFNIPNGDDEATISKYLEQISENIKKLGDNEKSIKSWWVWVIIAIALLGWACVILLLSKIKKLFVGKGTSIILKFLSDPEGVTPMLHTGDEDFTNIKRELDDLKSKIRDLLPNYAVIELTDEEILGKASVLLTSGNEAKRTLKEIQDTLDIPNNDIPSYLLLNKIEELKNSSSSASQDNYEKGKEDLYAELIDKILNKKNKILSEVVATAKNEKGPNQHDIIIKVIDLLPSKMKDEKVISTSAAESILITDNQLNHINNRYILKKWLAEQLRAAGINDFDKNKTTLDNLTHLSEQLKKANIATPHKADEDVVNDVTSADKLTAGQKSILIHKLIKVINAKIMDSSKSISPSMTLEEFTQSVADAFQQPDSHEEAQIQTQKRNTDIVNEALETDMTSLSKDAIKDAVKKIMLGILKKKLSNVPIDSYEDALNSLSTLNLQYKDLEQLLQEFHADKLENLPKAIRERQNNEVLKSVSDKVSKSFPGQNIDSVQRLVNLLFREVEESKENCDLIVDNLEEKISLLDKSYTSSESNRDALRLMDLYGQLVQTNETNLHQQIISKDNEIGHLNGIIGNQSEKLSSLETDNQNLMAESKKWIEDLHMGAEKIYNSCKTILNPCSDDEEAQCVDIENRLFHDLNLSVTKFKSFNVVKNTIPSDTRKAIQELLTAEINVDNSPINTVCRYFAYSQLPFMTDTAREYGITFKRRNMAELYSAIENLYVQFGINLNIPSLFVMGIEEGEFENVTGKMYGDLDNLCQNSRNHFDNIDSATKPSNVIVDIVNVGYSVDGRIGRVTSVLTY